MEEKDKRLPELKPEDLPLQEIERRTILFPQILGLAVKNTQASDWVDFGGNPWLDTPGAERIARVFGFTIKETRFEKLDRQDRDGPYYIYIWYGKCGLAKNDLWIDAIGTCSSRKPFHAIAHEKKKALEDINEMNILKDAYSNLVENGVTRFLGLRGLDWETLEKAGIERKKVARVYFDKGKKEFKPLTPTPPPNNTTPMDKEQPPQQATTADPTTPITPPEDKRPDLGMHHPEPPKKKPTTKDVNPAVYKSLLEYTVSKVLATRPQIEAELPQNLTVGQCNYVLSNLMKIKQDVAIETLKDIVRGAMALRESV
jgi:hypothetical protein